MSAHRFYGDGRCVGGLNTTGSGCRGLLGMSSRPEAPSKARRRQDAEKAPDWCVSLTNRYSLDEDFE